MAHDWLALLRESTDRFASTVAGADPGARVTWCPDWSLRDLVDHLGGVHQWAAHAVVDGNPDFDPEPVPHDADLAGWYRRHASALLEVLSQTPPDAPAWTLDKADRTAGFWRRRQVHETVMHTWDAEEALGPPSPIDASLAWDGVREVADVMYPRQVRLGRVDPLLSSLQLVATDVGDSVIIGSGEPVVVRDRAEVLLRLLWHRAPLDDLDPRAAGLLSRPIAP
ncbi:maleylpyruvate isomerase family mycothiol-dependent enzyme [Nocardioides hwasunensis]|uniref:Maleylpyruvate isomerase family mycothiol-dependent enzyme n=1 Tax=Nocardioides hwasunensis TaxID=397258 RepID=A0ABR8MLX0_9ACTN|nr:maleylpyruvate isomerase family mycothiol-dependent enzyme [Nocardioides hwasunensis]MBD3916555.1 maleylpyruvate isomerase family mycothiol-dependent enzyme [Nocardioides hwasunensis]